jgi:pimeloyl-ACP methyl ester carboxylesterase
MSAFVLVHGLCHGGWCWDPTATELAALGHDVTAVDLPLTGLDDDASSVADVLDGLDGPIVLVGHSSGGLVISRVADGRDDVSHLVYIAALMIGSDDVAGAKVAEFPPTLFNQRFKVSDDWMITIDPESAMDCFYNECADSVARAAAARLRPTSTNCLRTPTGAEPWNELPSTYVVCERDQTVHPDMQRAMSTNAGRVHSLSTDHSPFMSAPEDLLSILVRAAEEN